MTLLPATSTPDTGHERRARILDAAERCFIRNGFHRTTMQDVAAEAGMSAGNLYRYFPSKDAIQAGLAERDREEMSSDFAAMADSDEFFTAFERIGRKHLIEDPRDKMVLAVEIWSEATRNPQVARFCCGMENEVRGFMAEAFRDAQRKGQIHPGVDPDWLVWLLMTMADGFCKRRALEPDFDGAAELARGAAMFRAVFAGALLPFTGQAPDATAPSSESTS
jgi:AcrR family transcriptional regulator